MVGDGDFVDADTLLGELGGDLRLETETVFLDWDGLQNFPPHSLVACLHIREVQISEHIGHEREEAVAHGVPKVEHPVFLRTDKTRAKNGISFSTEDRVQQNRIFRGIILQIGILNDDNIRCRLGDARAQCRAFSLVFIVVTNAQAGIGIFDTLEFLAGAIARRIVHHDQLSNLRLLKNSFNNSSYCGPLVEYGHDYREVFIHKNIPQIFL